MRILTFALAVLAAPLAAHEFWIEPMAYQVNMDQSLTANMRNGEEFEGVALPYLPQRIENFVLFAGDAAAKPDSRQGDLPALDQSPLNEGLHILAYQSRIETLNYENWDKFQRFVDHKDLGDVRTQHEARNLPDENFKEVYGRYAKSLIGVGNGTGSDRRVGLETEIVALLNPYTDDLTTGMQVQLHYRDQLRSDEQIEVFEKAPDGSVKISLYRTDAEGVGVFPVKPGHEYMVDAVVLREPSADMARNTGAVWQTLWANLTFGVPE